MLQINELRFTLAGQALFDDLCLHLERGEHVVIVGDSGGGKSTLLALIAERKLAAIQLDAKCDSAMVLQQGALLDNLTVAENLDLVARYHANSAAPAALLEKLNIAPALHNRKVAKLSGGQMRRVAIARALVPQPDLLLFDEPDAGLDVANLSSLANTVKAQAAERACITVSHNPLYIAQVAQRVYRLTAGKLKLLASWAMVADSAAEIAVRQQTLQKLLGDSDAKHESPTERAAAVNSQSLFLKWCTGCWLNLSSLPHWPSSWRAAATTARHVTFLSLISGLVFFGLVGLMLGGTTIAVVRLLADNALAGFISLFIQAEDLLQMMGGVYVLYLAPPIGGMLFAARSGSILSSWLGEMVRGRQLQALRYVGVDTDQYIRAPSVVAAFVSAVLAMLWFTAAVWVGGAIAADRLFALEDPQKVMALSAADVEISLYWPKLLGYSLILSLTVVSLGMIDKVSSQDVNAHTTKAIIYSTLCISLAELLIILLS